MQPDREVLRDPVLCLLVGEACNGGRACQASRERHLIRQLRCHLLLEEKAFVAAYIERLLLEETVWYARVARDLPL